MKIEEHLRYLEGRIKKGEKALAYGLDTQNYDCAVLNIDNCFKNMLELGLITWRLGGSPVGHLQQALEFILKNRCNLMERGVRDDALRELPLFNSIYLAALLDLPHPVLDLEHFDKTLAPVVFFGNVLVGADIIVNWPRHQSKLPDNKRCALARATNQLYADLLSGAVSPEEGVRRGEAYFTRRKNDPYFQDSPFIEGGNDLNDKLVDFCLAAVLKKIGSTVPTVHAWRW